MASTPFVADHVVGRGSRNLGHSDMHPPLQSQKMIENSSVKIDAKRQKTTLASFPEKPAYLIPPDPQLSKQLWKVTHWHYPPCPTAGAPSFYPDPFHKWCTCQPPSCMAITTASTSTSSDSESTSHSSVAEETLQYTMQIRSKVLQATDYQVLEDIDPCESMDDAEASLRKLFPLGDCKIGKSVPDNYRRWDCKYPWCDFRARVVRSNEDHRWRAESLHNEHRHWDGLPLKFQTTMMKLLKSSDSLKTTVTLEKLVDALRESFPSDPLCDTSQSTMLSTKINDFLRLVRVKQRFYRKLRDQGLG